MLIKLIRKVYLHCQLIITPYNALTFVGNGSNYLKTKQIKVGWLMAVQLAGCPSYPGNEDRVNNCKCNLLCEVVRSLINSAKKVARVHEA